jgi:acid phosphatase
VIPRDWSVRVLGTNQSNDKNIFGIILGSFVISSIVLGIIFAGGIAEVAANDPGSSGVVSASLTSGLYSHHMVFIIMENHPLSSITSSAAPYMVSLANSYAQSSNFVGPVLSNWKPSLPNYIGLTSGSTQGITDDNPPSSHPITAKNVMDLFASGGVTWKAYMENMPSNCAKSDNAPYYVKHNPFPYYTDNAATSACAADDVPAGSTSCPQPASSAANIMTCDSNLINDLNSTASSSFIWLTPNICNDMHDCSVTSGSTYLSYLVPAILTTKTFENDLTATVIITFDEPSSGTYGTTPVYFVVAGPGARTHFTSSTKYTHLNFLDTVESNWSLGCLVSGGDCGAKVMSEFFLTGSTKLVFTTAAQTFVAGTCSLPITVQTQNSSGNPFNVTTNTIVGLATSSSGGAFYSDPACTAFVNSVTLFSGTNIGSFFYTDTRAGSPTITTSNTGLTGGTQTETINSAAPAKLAFTTALQVINTGLCSAGIKVQTQDSFGNPTTAGTSVALSTTSSSGAVYSDASCATATASVTISRGTSTVSFFYRDTAIGSPTITASATGFTGATQTESIVAPGPVKLVFTTPSQTLATSVCSSTMTVQSQNSAGIPTNVVANTVASLSTNSSGGTFYTDSICTTAIAAVTIATSTDSVAFYYRDASAGTPNLIASSSPLTPAAQSEVVRAAQVNGLQATFADSPINPQPGQSINFAATASGGGSPYVFKWDFGDGSSGTGQTTSHVYQKVGSYTTKLTVTDTGGQMVTATHILTVATVSSSTPGGICLQCLVRTLSLSTLLLIGLTIGLALTASIMALGIRRNRRSIRRLLRQRNASGRSRRF